MVTIMTSLIIIIHTYITWENYRLLAQKVEEQKKKI